MFQAPAVFMYDCVEYPRALQFALIRLPFVVSGEQEQTQGTNATASGGHLWGAAVHFLKRTLLFSAQKPNVHSLLLCI